MLWFKVLIRNIFFFNNDYIERYLEIIERYRYDFDFNIIAYCIMNNHAHFLIYAKDIAQFRKFMQKVNLTYAQFYNRKQHRYGILFRNRYQAEPILTKQYLINCIKYIHDNPLKAGIVKRSEDYKYSSCGNYMKNIGECKTDIMKKIFGTECDYKLIFENMKIRRFIDIEEDENTINEYIIEGIKDFTKEYNFSIYDIFSNREILKKLIIFLNEKCNIKYTEIKNYFEISRWVMTTLKNNKQN